MRAIGVTVVCVAALAMGACARDNGMLSDADRTAIRAASELYVKADDARDADAMVQLIAGKNLTGYYMDIWQKQTNGAWKITRKIWNSDK